MAWTYRRSPWRRAANALIRALLRVGLAPPRTYLLSVQGRVSGRVYSTPVTLVEGAGERWLVAPYGEVAWVRNARAAGEVRLSRGRRVEVLRIAEASPDVAAPVLRRYAKEVPITRPFFDASPDADLAAFAAEAPRHPVFRILGRPDHPAAPP
jgi:deazaflavin-dependent oxidoreductase (nitroreductase family)